MRQRIDRFAGLVAAITLPKQRHDKVATFGNTRFELALSGRRRKIPIPVRRPIVGMLQRKPGKSGLLQLLQADPVQCGIGPVHRRLDHLVVGPEEEGIIDVHAGGEAPEQLCVRYGLAKGSNGRML